MTTTHPQKHWRSQTCIGDPMDETQLSHDLRKGPFGRGYALTLVSLLLGLASLPGQLEAGPRSDHFAGLADEYLKQTRPLIQEFCLDCHSTEKKTGELDLERFTSLEEVRRGTQDWLKVAEMLDKGEMPPKFSSQLTPDQRQELRGWVQRYLDAEALANAGDPGLVVLRRLNNAEYTHTVRDLTGVGLDPVREFPTDSAAGEGFTNTGNSLAMSPGLLKKYLDAAKGIAQHAVLLPDGFRFSAQATRRDWTDEILDQIREFYGEFVHASDFGVGSAVGNVNVHADTRIGLAGLLPLEKYLAATLAERKALTKGKKKIADVARDRQLNTRYLATLWSSLTGSNRSLLLDDLRTRWRRARPNDAPALTAHVAAWQQGLWSFGPVGLIGRKGGPSRWMEPVTPLQTEQTLSFVIPKSGEGKPEADVVLSLVSSDAGDGNDHDFVVWQQPRFVAEGQPDILLRDIRSLARNSGPTRPFEASIGGKEWGLAPEVFGKHPNGNPIDPASLCVRAPSVISIRLPGHLLAGRTLVATALLEKETGREGSVQVQLVGGTPVPRSGLLPSEVVVAFSRVTQVFSDHRSISFKRPILIGEGSSKGAVIESALDEYRQLFPAALCFNQIVPVDEVLTLATFYREDDHLARLMLDETQRARLDRLWEELHYVSHSAFLNATAVDLLLEVRIAGNGLDDKTQYKALLPLREPSERRAAEFRKELIEDGPGQLDALIDFASRAYRRLPTEAEVEDLRGLYRRLREQELEHEEAFRLTLARVFVAPGFLYRLENAPIATDSGPVSDWELASRLSYFLWSSQPDEALRKLAAQGSLHEPEVIGRQAARMLRDPRVRRLAIEFACHYLHIHDFASIVEKSQKYYPEFADLRGDMYEESILFFTDLFQRGASLLGLLDANHTFVNKRLAKFYGIEGIKDEGWHRIEGMRQKHGRGGILGLATTLAKQSGASRTSPILRGNWISEVLLGEKLPRPPQDVPQLPPDETATDGLTVRQLVAKHTSEPQCASCHQRIDPFGYALEGFDAIGRLRDKDLAGRPIDTKTRLPDGTQIEGLTGLRDYLLKTRRDAVLGQFCRKLLGYALGREVQLSDQPLLAEMQQRLARNDYRFSVAVEMIVQSRQFLHIRGRTTQLAGRQ